MIIARTFGLVLAATIVAASSASAASGHPDNRSGVRVQVAPSRPTILSTSPILRPQPPVVIVRPPVPHVVIPPHHDDRYYGHKRRHFDHHDRRRRWYGWW